MDGDLDVKFCRRQGRKWELSRMPIMHANFLLCTNIWLNSYNAAGSTFAFNEKKISLKGCENRDWKLIVCFSQTQELRGFTLLLFHLFALFCLCFVACLFTVMHDCLYCYPQNETPKKTEGHTIRFNFASQPSRRKNKEATPPSSQLPLKSSPESSIPHLID